MPENPRLVPDNAVWLDGAWSSWDRLRRDCAEHRPDGGFRCFVVSSAREALSRCAWMAAGARDAMLLPRERLTPLVAQVLRQASAVIVEQAPRADCAAGDEPLRDAGGRVPILTSGTTGTPKLVSHTWATLFTARRARDLRPRTWLLPYQAGTYAWYQVVTLGLFVPGHRLVPVDGSDIPAVIDAALASGADAISSTPTFWRLAFLAAPERELQRLPLGQITLGGEIVDDALLARLRTLYPQAALTHIYASSEAGASIVVNDGRAGFPARWLAAARDARPPGGIALKMEDGKLLVSSPFSSRASGGRPGEWVDTGDRIEVREDRALFVGRSETQMINVGGSKAYPADIEAVLLSHPRVAWCRVSARKAAIVGFLPVAEVLLSDEDRRTAEQALFSYCSARLPDFAVPRMWTFVDRIPVTGALKSEVQA